MLHQHINNALAKYLALLVLAIFMTGISNVSTHSFVHDLQHDHDVKHTVAAAQPLPHHHVSQTSNDAAVDDADTDSKNIDISEHEILHALNHLQFFPDMAMADLSVLPVANTVLPQFAPQSLPLANIDPLLRPPQSRLLLA